MTLKKKRKNEFLTKKKNQIQRNNTSIKSLVKKALRNSPKWKPAKGLSYLEDLNIGDSFIMNGLGGILLDTSPSCSHVLVISSSLNEDNSNKNYYLGKQIWASKTEVKSSRYSNSLGDRVT